MEKMFLNTNFNGDISNWDVSHVTSMKHMFDGSKFDSDISNWKLNTLCKTDNMFLRCPIRDEYKPKHIIQEGFAFDSINKQHKAVNAYSILRERLLTILDTPIYKITKND